MRYTILSTYFVNCIYAECPDTGNQIAGTVRDSAGLYKTASAFFLILFHMLKIVTKSNF